MDLTHTAANGTVTNEPPAGPPQAGDVLQIDSVLFKAPIASTPSARP